MQDLGCDLLMVCSNVSPDSLGGIDRAAADFHELGERAAKRGMRVAFEALSWGATFTITGTHGKSSGAPAIRRSGWCSTVSRARAGTDLSAIRAIPKDRIFLVQMADAPKLDMDYLSWSRHYRCFPGQGELPIDEFMLALQATGFDGLLSLEIFNDRFRAGSASKRRSTGKVPHRHARRTPPENRSQHRRPAESPPKAAPSGIEFVEFAIDEKALSLSSKPLPASGSARPASIVPRG